MYLIPFYKKTETTFSGNTLFKLVLFLANGGTSFLTDVKLSDVSSFCEENGFVIQNQFSTENEIFLEVDTTAMDISSYYTYAEAYKTGNECWRTFILTISNESGEDDWNVNVHFKETPFYKSLSSLLEILRRKNKEVV